MGEDAYDVPTVFPAENGVVVYRTAIITPFFTAFFVFARFYARFYLMKRKPTIDDYIVAMTFMICITYSVLMGIAAKMGMGLHVWQYTKEINSSYYLWIGITSEFYCLGLAGFKSALVILYLQTFGLVSKGFRIACYLTLFYTLGYLTANLISQFLGCTPVEKFWNTDLPGHCIDKRGANTFFGVGHVTSDLIIAILPLRPIWKLSFPSTKQKIGLSFTLTTGFLAWAVATVRYIISTYDQFTYDRTWWAGIGFALSIVEMNTGLICACVPTFSPLLTAFSSFRSNHVVSSWTARASGVFHNSAERKAWEESLEDAHRKNWEDMEMNYHGHLDSQATTTVSSRKLSEAQTIVATMSHEDEMSLVNPYGKQQLPTHKEV